MEDDYYSIGDNAAGAGDKEDDLSDYDILNDSADDPCAQVTYTILKASDIQRRLDDAISRISTVLSISPAAACILLVNFNWSVTKVHEEWFADEEAVRKRVGILEPPIVQHNVSCGICLDSLDIANISSATCGHRFCRQCLSSYISTAINDGPGCLLMRCPDPTCSAAVGVDMINLLTPEDDRAKFARYLLRSYIDGNRKTKWCPAPGCEYAVDFSAGGRNSDVTCLCSFDFCWRCSEEAHSPVDCGTVSRWILKNSLESDNIDWFGVLAYRKRCPRCERPTYKSQGCMHMTCSPPCMFDFCWICLGAWSDHRLSCVRYKPARKEAVYEDAEWTRAMAKNSLERYTHYYERWAVNQLSRKRAVSDLNRMQAVYLDKLRVIYRTPLSQLKFITEAWLQIVECRKVLQWTYAYGYYIPETEVERVQFFECLQGEAEFQLERLHHCAEKELPKYFSDDSTSEAFDEFRSTLAGLTSVTKTYFENFVRALENGLQDVNTGTVSSSSPA